MKKEFFDNLWISWTALAGIISFFIGFYSHAFFFIAIFLIVFPLLYVFAKGLEEVAMVRTISGENLREGDWLLKDVRVGKNVIRANWDGLTRSDLKKMRKLKKVKIKDGLPFVPAFLIAFLVYLFFRNNILDIVLGIN